MSARSVGATTLAVCLLLGPGCGPSQTDPCTDCALTCDEGWADCNGNPADGCEVLLSSSRDACGACGVHCGDLPGVLATECVEGKCEVYGCSPGRGDCNEDPADGCEVDTTKTAEHCGACGNDCNASNMAHATEVSCVAGECASSCEAGFLDCNEDPADGCEADVQTSSEHCGACFQNCLLGACAGGRCQPVTVVEDAGIPVDVAVNGLDLYWTDTDPAAGAVRHVLSVATNAAPADIDVFAGGQLSPIGVAANEQFVFWTTWGDDAVHAMARDKSTGDIVLALGTFADPAGLAVSAKALYFTELDYTTMKTFGVYRVVAGTLTAEKLQTPPAGVSDVAVIDDSIYWTTPFAGGIQSAADAPMSPSTGTLGGVNAGFLASDDKHLYFSDGKSIKRVGANLSTAAVEVVVTVDTATSGVAVDDYFVYFAARDPMSAAPGKIYRMRKPW